MAQALLVAADRQAIATLTQAFDARGLDVRIIVIAKFDGYSENRIVLASPAFEQHTPGFDYTQFVTIVRELGLELDEDVPYPLILNMRNPVVLALQQSLGPIEDTRGLHIGLQTLGDRYLEDGYVFRIRP